MQAEPKEWIHDNPEQQKKLKKLFGDLIRDERNAFVPFDEGLLKNAINDERIDHVKVCRLKEGMNVAVEGQDYKVVRVRPDGKVVLKLK